MASPAGIDHTIDRAAKRFRLDPKILKRQLTKESNLDPTAKSGAGASGIAQFMQATADKYGVNLNDGKVTDDIMGAAHYDRDNLDANGGDWKKALSVYNSGKPDAYKDPSFANGQTYNYVKDILAGSGSQASSGAPAAPTTMTLQHGTEALTQTDPTLVKKQFFAQWLAKKNPNNPLIKLGVIDPNMSTTSTTSIPTTTGFSVSGGSAGGGIAPSNATTAGLVKRADEIDEKHLPYLWGGGHGGKVNAAKATPLDCSGAVSAVLGIDPRVASQFESWGKPGDSGKHGVTIYAKDTHVLMKIDGHMFGTSASNPGGGAGWIKQDQISPAYLKGFTVRHA